MQLKAFLGSGVNQSAEEITILNLTLKAQEGEFTKIELLCEKKDVNMRCITLSCEDLVFFKGYLLGGVEDVEPGCMKLMYVGRALAVNYAIQQEAPLLENINNKKWELPCVDPVSHQCKTISMLPSDMGKDITPYVLMDSTKVEQIRMPMHTIKVIVHAAWVQKGQGSINLFPYIKKAFPERRILSITGDALKASFPTIGQTLGKKMGSKTGYTVLSSKMMLCSQKTFDTVPVKIKGSECYLPIQEYKGHFWIQWTCAYRRQEKLELCLCWKNGEYILSPDSRHIDVCKTVDFTVKKDVISAERDTFFDTKIGNLAVRQAIEQSIYVGLQSRQAYLLKVDLPFVNSLQYKIGDTVIFDNNTTGTITGRVSRLKSFCDADHAITTVWINFSKACLTIDRISAQLDRLTEGIARVKGEGDGAALPNINTIEPEHLIKSAVVRNAACHQSDLLKNKTFDSMADLISILKNNMTEIHLDLHDLTNSQVIYQNYEFKMNE
ncbi:MAG TPA: hypothetical protein DIC42_05880 [Holosporales bacterium]|nr:hypothetical protein [Holosporales bacterium]